MAKTAVIYDIIQTEKLELDGFNKFLFGKYGNDHKCVFNIVYPDNSEEFYEYGVRRGNKTDGYKYPDSLIRDKCLQRIVNKFEKDGYNIYPDKLALFMNKKIDKLIMQKNK